MTTMSHVCLRVLDLDRSADFYRRTLGLTPQRAGAVPGDRPHPALSPGG